MISGRGVMYYCYQYNQCCMIISNKVPKNINKECKIKNDKNEPVHCSWEDVGSFVINDDGTIELHHESSEDFNSTQKQEFIKNIYDENMVLITEYSN